MASALPFQQPPDPVSTDMLRRGVELVPVPAIHLRREKAHGRRTFRFLAVNRAYRIAALGMMADRSPMLDALGDQIDAFLNSDDQRRDTDWTIGEAIDCRYYRVTMARTTALITDQCMMTFVDQTQQVQTARSLKREMTTDSLTGLPNREGFSDLVEGAAAAATRSAVLVVDLARFGRINACLGGLAGDELLITVARRIKGALRARDALARIGGNEFGVLLEIDEARDEAQHAAHRIQRALATPFRLSDYEISVDCSIGIAFAAVKPDGAGVDTEEMIRHAQFSVKRAKQSGRIETYENQAFTIARQQFGMETALRRAIEQRQLRLNYQPICDLATGRIVAFESLARWRHDDAGDIPPTQFIPVAEESGLIVPLGRWALAEATRRLAEWDRMAGGDCGVNLTVNVSPIQLQRDSVEDLVKQALRANGLAGSRLKLELTESALIGDTVRTAATLRALTDLGTTLAMDDFGTGYSNLALLQKLPIDILKIDRSFVSDMLADRDKVAIVRAILSLAQALGMRTVAEGVETNECAQTLAALGCTMGQGYFYARPLEPDAAWALIAPAG